MSFCSYVLVSFSPFFLVHVEIILIGGLIGLINGGIILISGLMGVIGGLIGLIIGLIGGLIGLIVDLRETVLLQISDMGNKTLSVLAHSFLLP